MSESPVLPLCIDTMNPNIKSMTYVVYGVLVNRAAEIEKELNNNVKKPFDEVVRVNIGDCHAMGQQPITFIRQILSMALQPDIIDLVDYPSDIKDRVRILLSGCRGESLGSYTDSLGIETIRQYVQRFIEERDGVPSDYRNIILSTGATQGIQSVLQLFNCTADNKKAGIMSPIPQYPLYTATVTQQGMHLIPYFLEEETNWGLNIDELKRAIKEAKDVSNPRALVVINPGNPTGQVLTRANMEEIIKFAYEENLMILADEVYQHNIFDDASKFHSFKKVLVQMGAPYDGMQLASFMSCSKGYTGECGLRGGFVEILNFPEDVKAMYFKSLSAHLCPSTLGQAAVFCLANPPKMGEPSYELYIKERTAIIDAFKQKADLVHRAFNSFEGFSCTPIRGAMYAFPQIVLPPKAIEAAAERGMAPDQYYTSELLENTGVDVVHGTGFGQKPGTYHFRTTILPEISILKRMLERIRKFHIEFCIKHT